MKKQKIKITVFLLLFLAYTEVQAQNFIVDFAVYNFPETASTVTLNSGTTYQFKNLCRNLCEFTDYTWFIIPNTGFTIDNTKASEPFVKFTVPGSYQVNFKAYTYATSFGWLCANQTLQKNKINYINVPYTIPLAQFKTDGAIVPSKIITVNNEVSFTDDSANYPTQWSWTVSPSTGWSYTAGSSSSKNPKIKFSANGNYTVSLKVTNPAGNNTITKTSHIAAIAIAPVANFNGNGSSAAQINIEQNATVNFTDLSSNSPSSWGWSISPSSGWSYTSGSSTSATPTIKFTSGGIYSVSLTVSNSGGSNVLRKTEYINVKPVRPTVTSSITYCKGETASSLTATGTNLKWYSSASGGTGSSTAPKPSTSISGTTSYYVSQTVNGIESLRSQINVVVNQTNPPFVSNRNYCLGALTSVLTASGSNLKWYSSSSGGGGSSSAPLPLSNTVGSTNYYVSQTVNGCESDRVILVVTIVAVLAAPEVVTPVSYCKNSIAKALSATGVGLHWYSVPSGGAFSTTPPIPSTSIDGTTSYYVSQSFNGCSESSRSQINVIVSSIPAPAAPVVSSSISYKMDSVAQALTATGSDLRWYIGETALSAAPIPSTDLAGNTSYFVTQTVNGCESPKAEITVKIIPPPEPMPTPDWSWAKSTLYYPPGNSNFSKNIAIDNSNNIYITGRRGTLFYDGITLPTNGEVILAKYNSNGNLIWATSEGGQMSEGYYIAVDNLGNVYVTGTFKRGNAIFGNTTLPGNGESVDGDPQIKQGGNFIAKYNSLGKILWAKQFTSPKSSAISGGIDVDASGNTYITGLFAGSATFDNQIITGNSNFEMFNTFLAKYNSEGKLVWVKRVNETDEQNGGGAIKVDRAGNSYFPFNKGGIAKYNADGTKVWFKLIMNGVDSGNANGLTIDDQGNSYVAGAIFQTTGSKHFIAKYDVNGNNIWLNKFTDSQYRSQGSDITLDAFGNIYSAGQFNGQTFIAKYNPFGEVIWTKERGGYVARAIVVDNKQNCYVTGEFTKLHLQTFDNAFTNIYAEERPVNFFGKLGSAPAEIKTNTLDKSVYCINEAVVVSFTTTGKFANDNIFTAQLSDSQGLFTNPTNLGSNTLNTFSVAIPTSVTSGNKYRIRIIASNPNTIGSDNGTDLTINEIVSPTFIQISEICSGDTLASLPTTSTNAVTGTWSPALNNLATTTYTFTPSTGQCANTTTLTITVTQQPVQPTLACYETATFNTRTCQWDVIGTAPLAPTGTGTQIFGPGKTIADIIAVGTGVKWYASVDDASSGTNPLASTTPLVGSTTYYATQTINGCESTATLAITVTVSLNVNEFDSKAFAYYPHPVSNELNLSYSYGLTSVRVTDITGRLIYFKKLNENSVKVDMSSMVRGVYFVEVTSDNSSKTIKVIKE